MTRSQSIVLTLILIGTAIALHIVAIDYYTVRGIGRALGQPEGQAIAEMLQDQGVKGVLPVVVTSFGIGEDKELALVAGSGLNRLGAALLGLLAPPLLIAGAYFIELGSHARRRKSREAAAASMTATGPTEVPSAGKPSKRVGIRTIAIVVVCAMIVGWAIWMLVGINPY